MVGRGNHVDAIAAEDAEQVVQGTWLVRDAHGHGTAYTRRFWFSSRGRQLEEARRSSIETLQSTGTDKVGLALTLYHQFDPLATQYQAEVAVPVGNNTPLSNYKRHEFNGGLYFKMTLRGDLGYLPLGWYALHSHCRMHKIKLDTTRPALEIYLGDTTKITDGNQFSTALYIPIK